VGHPVVYDNISSPVARKLPMVYDNISSLVARKLSVMKQQPCRIKRKRKEKNLPHKIRENQPTFRKFISKINVHNYKFTTAAKHRALYKENIFTINSVTLVDTHHLQLPNFDL
jgi:hypothetical protein